jgi:hypothetical protein
MALELQNAVVELVTAILEVEVGETPQWLMRPGKLECRGRWELVRDVYATITGGADLPETMPPRERRSIDCVLVVDGQRRMLEVDEKQHFNRFRAQTLQCYPDDLPVAFPVADWIAASERKVKLEGGGFAKPRPPLFPEQNGRHQQRAFRDALADILPGEYDWLPTLRIADFEVKDWVFGSDAREQMMQLLETRLGSAE